MDVQKVLGGFTQSCWDKLDLSSIIQFGSSTYSKNPDDIDLMVISNKEVFPSDDILKLLNLIKEFEKKFPGVIFDFTGLNRKKTGKYTISIVFLGKKELSVIHNPHDLIFFKDFSKDKSKKILFGNDLFKNLDINLDNKHLFEALTVNQKHALRKALDDSNYGLDSFYDFFKSILRIMLINENVSKKDDLLKAFEKKYGKFIPLPLSSDRILSHKLKKEDFDNILKFSDDCLRYLVRSR